MIKLLIGGSPCTYWSVAQKNNREVTADGLGWELFKNYLIAKEKFNPDFFLYENNKSAAQPIKDQISHELGVDLMHINSALVSAQNRQRFYAFNWDVEQPEDRGIVLRDVLESGIAIREKSYTLDANYYKTLGRNVGFDSQAGRRKMVAEPVGVGYRNRREDDGKLYRRFETDGDPKSNALTTVQTDSMVAEPIQVDPSGKSRPIQASYGKYAASDSFKEANPRTGVAIRIGSIENDAKNQEHDSQQYRVYSPDGKSVTVCGNGGGVGAKTGLYATPVCMRYERTSEGKKLRKQYENGEIKHGYHEFCELHPRMDGKSNTLTTVLKDNPICEQVQSAEASTNSANGNSLPVYEVKNGYIEIKGKSYPIKLADGYYIIRKLTTTECERLQTLPDGYTSAVSNTQRYKGLGNGWTAEVIIHVLWGALKNVPKDEEIVVLSMYDGIGTGRYCLEKMGFTNVTYYAYEIDKYAMQVSHSNYPDIIQLGDAFDLRLDDWTLGKRSADVPMLEQTGIETSCETDLSTAPDDVKKEIIRNATLLEEQALNAIPNNDVIAVQVQEINALEQLRELVNERKRLSESSPQNCKYANDIAALHHAINVLIAVGQ